MSVSNPFEYAYGSGHFGFNGLAGFVGPFRGCTKKTIRTPLKTNTVRYPFGQGVTDRGNRPGAGSLPTLCPVVTALPGRVLSRVP